MPRISVVIPSYNAEAWLARAIDSALAQPAPEGWAPVEVIVADDGSTDDSVAVARRYGDRVLSLPEPNGGACVARNRGLAAATGAYVCFLDSDDLLEGPILSAAARVAEAQAADIVLSPQIIRFPGRPDVLRDVTSCAGDPNRLFSRWVQEMQLNPSAVLWRADYVRAIGGWDETLAAGQDTEIMMRGLARGGRVAGNPQGRGVYCNENPGSITHGVSERRLNGVIDSMERIMAHAAASPFNGYERSFYEKLYGVARTAYSRGFPATGRRAEALMRRAGDFGHIGTLAHRAACAALGLERKVTLWEGARRRLARAGAR